MQPFCRQGVARSDLVSAQQILESAGTLAECFPALGALQVTLRRALGGHRVGRPGCKRPEQLARQRIGRRTPRGLLQRVRGRRGIAGSRE